MIGRRPGSGVLLAGLFVALLLTTACLRSNGAAVAKPPASLPSTAGVDVVQLAEQITQGRHLAIKSSDGMAELLIPESALPRDVKAADLKVTPVTGTEAKVTVDGKLPLFSFRLEPEGLAFSALAVIRISTQLSTPGDVPELLMVSREGPQWLDSVAVEADRSTGRLVVNAPIAHFSQISGFEGLFRVSIADPGDRAVGESFELAAVTELARARSIAEGYVKSSPSEPVGYKFTYERLFADRRGWSLGGDWQAKAGVISPSLVKDAPSTTRLSAAAYTANGRFTCAQAGEAAVSFGVTYRYDVETIWTASYDDGSRRQVKDSVQESRLSRATTRAFQCKSGPLPTATPPPSPTPTPAPPSATPSPTATPTSTPVPQRPVPTATPTAVPAAVAVPAFARALGQALRANDTAFLFRWLHPAVINYYGSDRCRTHFDQRTLDPTYDIQVTSVQGPAPWTLVLDQTSIPISYVYTAQTNTTRNGQTTETTAHFGQVDGQLYWFTMCTLAPATPTPGR